MIRKKAQCEDSSFNRWQITDVSYLLRMLLISLFSPSILYSSFNSYPSHLSLLPRAFMDLYSGHLECDMERIKKGECQKWVISFLTLERTVLPNIKWAVGKSIHTQEIL